MQRAVLLLLVLSLIACTTGTAGGPDQPGGFSPDVCLQRAELPPDVEPPVSILTPQPGAPRSGPDRGYACVQATIDVEGRVSDPEILDTNNREFALSVSRTVRNWKFEPATREGEPVEIRYTLLSTYQRY